MTRSRQLGVLALGVLALSAVGCAPDAQPTAPGLRPSAAVPAADAASDDDGDAALSDAEQAAKQAARDAARAAKRAEKDELERMRKEWKAYKTQVRSGSLPAELLRCEPQRRQAQTRTIGPRGGTIQIGPHRFEIPAGALSRPVEITGVAPSGPLVDVQFEPHGLRVAKPVELTISYEHCMIPDSRVLQVVYLGNGQRVLAEQPSVDDDELDEVRALTDHFSGYAVAVGRGM